MTGHFHSNFCRQQIPQKRGIVCGFAFATYFTQIYGFVFSQVLPQTQIYIPFSTIENFQVLLTEIIPWLNPVCGKNSTFIAQKDFVTAIIFFHSVLIHLSLITLLSSNNI